MSNQKSMTALIKALSGQANTLTIPRIYITITGDIKAALLLSQCIYWSDKTSRKDGFFYKSQAEWQDEIGLTRSELDTAYSRISHLVDYELHRASGAPTGHYRVNFDALTQAIENGLADLQESDKSDLQKSGKSDLQETSKCLTETTHKTTSHPESLGDSGSAEIQPRKRTPLQDAQSVLEDTFAEKTGIQKPPRLTRKQQAFGATRWWGPLGNIWRLAGSDVTKAQELMNAAIEKMERDKLTISAPQSIEQVCISLARNGNMSAHIVRAE